MVGAILFAFGGISIAQEPVGVQSQTETVGAVSDNSETLSEELRGLIHSLHELRSGYYQRQATRRDKIGQMREVSIGLKSQVEELRGREEEVDGKLAQKKKEIEKLRLEIETAESVESAIGKRLEQFVGEQVKEIESSVPCRREQRLARLKGVEEGVYSEYERTVAAMLGRIWNFSQEELRMARSGETFTDLIDLGEGRGQYARVFRVGHQLAGYLTETGEQAGIWRNGGWEKVEGRGEQAVKAAISILDRRAVPEYVDLPIRMGPLNIQSQGGEGD